ncbi:flagellar protein FlgN [Clostridium saccharobutylicum]|uniref:FlgN family protein n=1 Tax=Clostridium saccharobutylicum DSM 13864 TaxID=1345695 RepID=U5MWN9_CLOSA|nr:flagellar protein FlgN [Clostridium saccharobutylicum]AGX44933.1 FlgN family protein [Clostridium saccharobutylicum DSM 13864]AQR92215.1 FlgN protein [Clostridium saccharobutylicum]AQS02117.1 FlgN protein [Clostridium saccharobutylicum]AQS11721.1 FlgN protein [Clostridium saccharobutylicum]AQS16100.1 FlgN protein [Clostridium saccharobutylicum]
MVNELIELIKIQSEDLKKLLMLLEIQYKMIMNKDVFGLEGLVDKMNECGKRIAQEEVQRRELIGNESIKEIVSNSNDEVLKEVYGNIRKILEEVKLKKDTNDMLLKQEIVFNNKMLAIMNPSKEIKTYNSYGSLSR